MYSTYGHLVVLCIIYLTLSLKLWKIHKKYRVCQIGIAGKIHIIFRPYESNRRYLILFSIPGASSHCSDLLSVQPPRAFCKHPLWICKLIMSAAAGRVAGKLGNAASKAAETATKSGTSDNVLKKAAKRDPELYVWNMGPSTSLLSTILLQYWRI